MTDAELLQHFTQHSHGGCFYLREQATGKRTRLYINLQGCQTAAEHGLLYTDAEYARLTAIPVGAKPRKTVKG